MTSASPSGFLAGHRLAAYWLLAFGLSWGSLLLARIEPAVASVYAFGPAIAAGLVVAGTGGRAELIALLRHTHQWRVALRWYLAAIGMPAGIALAVAALDWLLGGRKPFEFADLPLLAILVVPFYLGEEIGWRGFALPELLRRRSPLVASLVLGLVWASWHVPFFAARLEAFPLYMVIVTTWTVLFTWLWLGAAGSLVVVTLMHAMFNDASVLKAGVEPAWNDLLTALVSIAVAAVVAVGWRRWKAGPGLAGAVI